LALGFLMGNVLELLVSALVFVRLWQLFTDLAKG